MPSKPPQTKEKRPRCHTILSSAQPIVKAERERGRSCRSRVRKLIGYNACLDQHATGLAEQSCGPESKKASPGSSVRALHSLSVNGRRSNVKRARRPELLIVALMGALDEGPVSQSSPASQQYLRFQRPLYCCLPLLLSAILPVAQCVALQIASENGVPRWSAAGLSKGALERYRSHIRWHSGAADHASPSSATFSCFDGSRTILLPLLNDDYCDCADGSDEPSTSACATPTQAAAADGPDSLFWCLNTGFRPHGIPRWQVRDGICDCCDGSDELPVPSSDHPIGASKCPNTCLELGKALREQQEKEAAAYNKGRSKYVRLLKESEALQQKWKATQEELRNSVLPSLEKKISAIQQRLEGARKAQERATRLKTAPLPVSDDPQEVEADASRGGVEPDTIKQPDTHAAGSMDRSDETLPSSGRLGESPDAAEPPVMESESKPPVISEYAQWMEKGEVSDTPVHEVSSSPLPTEADADSRNKNEAHSEAPAVVKDNGDEISDSGETDSNPTTEVPFRSTKGPEPTTEDTYLTAYIRGFTRRAQSLTQRAMRALFKKAFPTYTPSWLSDFLFSETDLESDVVSLEHELQRLESDQSTHQQKLHDVDAKLRLAEGPAANVPALLPLFKKCFVTTADKYRYEVCLLTETTQKVRGEHSAISLGTFKALEVTQPKVPALPVQEPAPHAGIVLHYEDGTPCWNGPNRSIAVHLRCGAETRLMNVIEAERCVYKAEMTSPALCAPELVSTTQEEHPAFSHEAHEYDEL